MKALWKQIGQVTSSFHQGTGESVYLNHTTLLFPSSLLKIVYGEGEVGGGGRLIKDY